MTEEKRDWKDAMGKALKATYTRFNDLEGEAKSRAYGNIAELLTACKGGYPAGEGYSSMSEEEMITKLAPYIDSGECVFRKSGMSRAANKLCLFLLGLKVRITDPPSVQELAARLTEWEATAKSYVKSAPPWTEFSLHPESGAGFSIVLDDCSFDKWSWALVQDCIDRMKEIAPAPHPIVWCDGVHERFGVVGMVVIELTFF